MRYSQIVRLLRAAANTSRSKSKNLVQHRSTRARKKLQAVIRTVQHFSALPNAAAARTAADADKPTKGQMTLVAKNFVQGGCCVILRHSCAKQITLFKEATVGLSGTEKEEAEAIARIFIELDVDGDGVVSFHEFDKWLAEWLDDKSWGDTAKQQLQQRCRITFDKALGGDGSGEAISPRGSTAQEDLEGGLTEEDFHFHFMKAAYNGAVEALEEAGLWTDMTSASLAERRQFEECFRRYSHDDNGGNRKMDTLKLSAALLELDLHPTSHEIETLLYTYDEDHNQSLDVLEFTRLCFEYIRNGRSPSTFKAPNWCPINFHGLELDFLAWGDQTTAVTAEEISTRNHEGWRGRAKTSDSSHSSIEMAKTRWMHVMGNAVPLSKINNYIIEMVLIFTLLKTHKWFVNPINKLFGSTPPPPPPAQAAALSDALQQESSAAETTAAEIAALSIASCVFLARIAFLFVRKRGIATVYCWGKPSTVRRGQIPKCQFPVPIDKIETVSQAFLKSKGVDRSSVASTEIYRTKLPGYGCVPLRYASWRGIHTASFGDRHFKLEKVSGGGGKQYSRRLARVDFMVGLLEDVRWVHVRKEGKSVLRLLRGLCAALFSGALITLPIVLALATRNAIDEAHKLLPWLLIPWALWSSVGCLIVIALWALYTPAFAELGLLGVDLTRSTSNPGVEPYSSFRISHKHLFERVLLPRYARHMLSKIEDARIAASSVTQSPGSDSTFIRGVRQRWEQLGLLEALDHSAAQVNELEVSSSIDVLAGVLFDAIDERGQGFLSIKTLRQWNDKNYSRHTTKDWVHSLHEQMISTFEALPATTTRLPTELEGLLGEGVVFNSGRGSLAAAEENPLGSTIWTKEMRGKAEAAGYLDGARISVLQQVEGIRCSLLESMPAGHACRVPGHHHTMEAGLEQQDAEELEELGLNFEQVCDSL
jgi:Ca2+-binding EF-hand superfamily protein